ncbi:putative post-transcriptional gene silencing PAZ-Argonaute family [Helianthus annuus]|uniref:Post-transcriptional gene silencing PAZ-Argonaute family n=1 Tax=Helianthus annuus TaxID=4232 RepID=A0A251TMC6_HELAN|nr:protein argonaute 7 isoform X1 [Helianthus annuus]KAF5757798.1 putative post-transcriptional gene silencing PAZ-Argonaute family [Helianthus annuus]KAJ0638260.1 putative post-transcriptional gene silencing PAZ-Argonaute family protein [Helianthus annuus]
MQRLHPFGYLQCVFTMEESDKKKCTATTKSFRGSKTTTTRTTHNNTNPPQHQHFYHHHHLFHLHPHYLFHNPPTTNLGFLNQNLYPYSPPPLLPLPPPHSALSPPPPPVVHLNHAHFHKPSWQQQPPHVHHHQTALETIPRTMNSSKQIKKDEFKPIIKDSSPSPSPPQQPPLTVARRPDSGGSEGTIIPLLANHFLVEFDPLQQIHQYDIEITPKPSKETARLIKNTLINHHPTIFSNTNPCYDGRRTLFSPTQLRPDPITLQIQIPLPNSPNQQQKSKLYTTHIKLVAKLNGQDLTKYLTKTQENQENQKNQNPLPQDYLQALDVVLRENPSTKCTPLGRSLYSTELGGSKDIGGGAVAIRGFFQSLRPTQQGLSLNVDLTLTAFHNPVGVIQYLENRLPFFSEVIVQKSRKLTVEEKEQVEKALKNIKVVVCHRETVQRYKVANLTEESVENLRFRDRSGESLRVVEYFKEVYGYEIKYRNLPCLQTSRRRVCYLPMEVCVVCDGQKFMGKLSDEQTARMLKLGCQKPRERKAIIDGVMAGPFGPSSGRQAGEFNLRVLKEMTKLNGRILRPPRLKLGDGGEVTDLIPSRHDRQWNFTGSHVFEGSRIGRWALISFGGTDEQKSIIPKFIDRLTQRCEQLGIFLNRNTVVRPQFESMQVLNNVSVLESKIKKIQRAANNNLQLLVCVMEKKHKGYADLKRISETSIGVMSQCCLYQNLARLSSQFLGNLALKINAKIGGCTVALYTSLPAQIPRVLTLDEPVMFLGADVTHPHPLDDFSPSVAAVVGSVNWPAANKYVSKMRSQTHRQEIIHDLADMVEEILNDFVRELSKLPKRLIFFRDGVSETQFQKVLADELQAIREACRRFTGYNPPISFVVVQKRHHTRLFPADPVSNSGRNMFSDENVPPGTVVDSVVTHPKEFDFYLCSHWGVKGTSRPTHYHILWDENRFTSDEFQKLVYNLCFTFVRCTKPVSLVPPCYYAHLAAFRGRLYLDRTGASSVFTRRGPPKTAPLPKVRENVKNLMFYC